MRWDYLLGSVFAALVGFLLYNTHRSIKPRSLGELLRVSWVRFRYHLPYYWHLTEVYPGIFLTSRKMGGDRRVALANQVALVVRCNAHAEEETFTVYSHTHGEHFNLDALTIEESDEAHCSSSPLVASSSSEILRSKEASPLVVHGRRSASKAERVDKFCYLLNRLRKSAAAKQHLMLGDAKTSTTAGGGDGAVYVKVADPNHRLYGSQWPLTLETTVAVLSIGVDDLPSVDIAPHFPFAVRAMLAVIGDELQHHSGEPPKMLVHCAMGVSRSATVLLAYLVRAWPSRSLDEHLAHLRKTRPHVHPNHGFFRQLQQWVREA
jgi:hypothetical protein